MKKSNLFYGFLAGCGFMLLLSAKMNSSLNEETPRYHLTFLAGGGYVYDAVTGNYRKVNYNELNQTKNIKDLLKESGKN
ncbi:hypothetical protein I5M27_14590 [Adhaeribacter sp. BT258]|uniref:Uncharacterized protein n=1 Tax=Adhaeribacter terrigena TaxID=2793070 RepID=A0ABS1C4A4_9BACT|nr:hypothetical protein [Adhaeribacter terrigena]MBK0404221.1 hypothetical protein [Adhaeribacter terrigena]